MSKTVRILIVVAVLGVAAYILLSPMALSKVSCEVCMEFRGNEACRTARGPSREAAMATARDNACAQIASGRAESMQCGGAEAKSARCSE